MKIENLTHTLERGGLGAERTFRIQTNARAFQILSKNLYTRLIEAVVRELSCNAWDSHVAAGTTDTPFDVHLPSSMEPWFSVTDHGLGLTGEQVMDLYTTYFSSSKTTSNDYIGALGLGSKSAFAYTNTFDVTAIHNGVARNYVMFLNEIGEPAVAPMGETPTTAHNGVTVRLPVEPKDFEDFRVHAEQVFSWFENRPRVVGNRNYTPRTHKIYLQGTNWRLLEREYNSQAVARMGSVVYRINPNLPQFSKFQRMLNNRIVIDFKIGELDVAASREELSYDPTTVEVLTTRFSQVLTEISEVLAQKLTNCTSMWEARIQLREIVNDYQTSTLYNLVSGAGFSPQFQGQKIELDNNAWAQVFDKKDRPRVMSRRGGHDRFEGVNVIHPDARAVIVRKDVFDANSRARLHQKDHGGADSVYYMVDGGSEGWEIDDERFERLIQALGNPPTLLASSMPRPPRQVVKFQGQEWTGHRGRRWGRQGRQLKGDNWGQVTELSTAMTQRTFYVLIKNLDPAENGEAVENFQKIVESARQLKLIERDNRIWGISKTNSRTIEKDDHWTEFMPWLRAQLTDYVARHQLGDAIANKRVIDQLRDRVRANSQDWTRHFGTMTNLVGDFARAYSGLVQVNREDLESARTLAGFLGISLDTPQSGPTVLDAVDLMVRSYPLLRHATLLDGAQLAEFAEYVKSVDITRKLV